MARSSRVFAVSVLAVTLVGSMLVGGASAAPTRLRASLDGANEVPGPGDGNGTGSAAIRVDPAERRVCFAVSWAKIRSPFAAHIHRGGVGVAGPVKVTLFSSTKPLPTTIDKVSGCIDGVGRTLARNIARDPARFYVNVHNRPFPDGAIRGQLQSV